MNSAQIRTPFFSVMSVGAHNRQQQVLIPILIMGIDKPYIVVWGIEAGGAVVLAFLSGPEVLDIQRVGQVDIQMLSRSSFSSRSKMPGKSSHTL